LWEIYNDKIEVVSFVKEAGRKLTICIKFEVTMKKWERGSCFFYLKSGVYEWNQVNKLTEHLDTSTRDQRF
jgi:hypothetical protein